MKKRVLYERYYQQVDHNVTSILKALRDTNFSNIYKRQSFVHLIAGLAASSDPRARKTIKKLGEILTDLADELMQSPTVKYRLNVRKERD